MTKQSAPTGVLSIGDAGSERRIQNVADGAADSDAVTVRQLLLVPIMSVLMTMVSKVVTLKMMVRLVVMLLL